MRYGEMRERVMWLRMNGIWLAEDMGNSSRTPIDGQERPRTKLWVAEDFSDVSNLCKDHVWSRIKGGAKSYGYRKLWGRCIYICTVPAG